MNVISHDSALLSRWQIQQSGRAMRPSIVSTLVVSVFTVLLLSWPATADSANQQSIRDSLIAVRDRTLATKWRKEIDLACDYAVFGNVEEAKIHFLAALSSLKTMNPPARDYAMGTTLYLYGRTLNSVKNWREADPQLREALDVFEQWPSPPDTLVAACKRGLAEALVGLGSYVEAESLAYQALVVFAAGVDPSSFSVADALHTIADAKRGLGAYREARQSLQQALMILDQLSPPDIQSQVECLVSMAICDFHLKEESSCAQLLEEAQGLIAGDGVPDETTRWVYRVSLEFAQSRADEQAVTQINRKLVELDESSGSDSAIRARFSEEKRIAYDDYMRAKKENDKLNRQMAMEARFLSDAQRLRVSQSGLASAMGIGASNLLPGVVGFHAGVASWRIPGDFNRHQEEQLEVRARMRAAKVRFESIAH